VIPGPGAGAGAVVVVVVVVVVVGHGETRGKKWVVKYLNVSLEYSGRGRRRGRGGSLQSRLNLRAL